MRILALVVVLVVLTAGTANAARTVPRGFYGTNYGGNVELVSSSAQRALWKRLAKGGVESARVLFNWEIAQRKPHGVPDWSHIDALVVNAVARGMSVLPVVEYAPGWAKRYPGVAASPPKKTSDYTAFLRLLIARYGPNGSFWLLHRLDLPKRPIREWQIWNEPEIAYHWYRKPFSRPWAKSDARDYVALLRAAYKTVHDADHGAKVVAAALSIDSWITLGHLYDWTSIKGAFDVAAIQAYSGTTSFLPKLMRNFRSVLNKHGAKSVPMYATEMTWPAAKGRANPHYTTGYMSGFITDQAGAAKRLTEGYRILRSMRSELKLGRVYWYTGATPYAGSNEFDYSGLLTLQKGKPKALPIYSAYQKSAAAAEGCAKNTNGGCR